MTSAAAYYAVLDPSDPTTITYWRQVRADRPPAPWPAKARYGPLLYRDTVPADLTGEARHAWVRRWHETIRHPWPRAVWDAIDADPHGCQAMFASFTTRCCCCGKQLTDATSKVYGIGPDCRRDLSRDTLARMAAAVGRAHAAHLDGASA